MATTMFERYGGFASVSRIVSAFYGKVLDSPVIAPYFENTDMKKQIEHQTKFISQLMGGPASYTDDELERKHSHLNIDKQSFDEIAYLLRETLEDFDFDDADIDTICQEVTSRAKLIIKQH